MKIIDNRKKENTKNFGELKIGETFCTTKSSAVFMKVENFYYEYNDGYFRDCDIIANAFYLNDGKKTRFNSSDKVIPLNCECVIKDK